MSGDAASGFWHWWSAELRDLLPRWGGNHPAHPSCIVLTPYPGYVAAFAEEKGAVTRIAMPVEASGDPTAMLAQLGRGPGSKPIGIRVRSSDCLDRAAMLPARARKDFDKLLLLDLERSTPLRAADVLSAHLTDGRATSDGLISVRHLVIKRRVVEPLLSAMLSAGLKPAFIECWNSDATARLPVAFSTHGEAAYSPPRSSLTRVLAAICALLLLALPASDWGRKELALASLSRELEQLKAAAQISERSAEQTAAGRAELDGLRRVLEQRTPTVVLLDEVTRLVPDGAWLDELRIDGESLEIAGTAPSAAALLAVFERSRLFFDARFTAPVRLLGDALQEQFRLRARLRAPKPEVSP